MTSAICSGGALSAERPEPMVKCSVSAIACSAMDSVTATPIADIRRHGASLVMTVADDGRGIPEAPATLRSGHFGLRALAGLADGLGATLDLESAAGHGTVLRVEVPMA